MDYININGRLIARHEANLQANNGAFRYGYGLFETLLVQHGEVQLWHYHHERLMTGMQLLFGTPPAHFTPSLLHEQIVQTAARNEGQALCRVRLQVFSRAEGIFTGGALTPEWLIECLPIEANSPQLNTIGWVVGIADGLHKAPDELSAIKTSNALIYAMGARKARVNGWNDALVRNTLGRVMETTIGNLFWIKNGAIYTPPLTEGCIAGVMRRHIMEQLGTVTEAPLTSEALLEADELFLTNAIRRIKWVGSWGSKTYGYEQVRELFNQLFPGT
ncbi:MAG: hypothetical protein EBZ77_03625 [Chitinophagia bacterium]|nr:hypothetical protein [Chitinophagia bacterium]